MHAEMAQLRGLLLSLLQGVYTKKVSVLPRPITPSSFSDRIQAVDNVTSAAMYAALQGAHLLDLKDMLVQDPRCACPITPLNPREP